MLYSSGHTSGPFREEQGFVRWTEEKVGHFIKGNIKYKGPERLDTAYFVE